MRKRMQAKTLYLSEKENKILNKKCKELNMSVSEYIRKQITDYKIYTIDVDMSILRDYSEDLKQINKGINNLTRNFHKYGYFEEENFKIYIKRLNEIFECIRIDLDMR